MEMEALKSTPKAAQKVDEAETWTKVKLRPESTHFLVPPLPPAPAAEGGNLFFIPWLHQKGQMNLLAKESGAREKRTQTSIGAPACWAGGWGQSPRQNEEGSLMFPCAHHSEEHVFCLVFVTYLHLFERQQFWHLGSFFSCIYVCLTDYLWK